MKLARLHQASRLFADVVTIERALSDFCRQGYLKHFLIPGDEAIKIAQLQFLDVACFCRVIAPKLNVKMKSTKKLGCGVVAAYQ